MKRLLSLVLLLALVTTGCAELFDPAAAVVGGDKITFDEVEEGLERFEGTPEFDRVVGQSDPQAIRRQFQQSYLSQLIRRSVLTPIGEELGIEVTDADVEARLDQIKADFPTESAFEEALKEQGLTLEQLTQLVRDSELENKIRAEVTADAAPSEAELEAIYEERQDEFVATEAQHILVEDRSLAKQLAEELRAAPPAQQDQLFTRLARQHSTDQTNANDSGKLGSFRPGEFVPEFEQAAAELDIGEISDPVRTEFGFHVIWVTGREELSFEEARPQIEAELGTEAQDQAWQEFVTNAYEEADIKVNPRFGEFDLESQQVVDVTAEDIPGAEEPATPTPDPNEAIPPVEGQ
jgi:parvulin-like peptidyl-prolyl isomerase